MKRYALLLVFCVLGASGAVFAQTKSPVEGVWRIAEVTIPGSDPAEKGTTISNPQPGLLIFTKGYYSTVTVASGEPRVAVAPAKDPGNLTDAEKIALFAQWLPFFAHSGTYEIKGSTLIRRAIVAKNVAAMTRGTPNLQEFKLEGPNTLWLLPTPNQPATEPRIKLMRLE